MSASPHANGGAAARRSACRTSASTRSRSTAPGAARAENTRPLGAFLREVMRANPESFRLFGPDETTSNRLAAVYEASKKLWLAELAARGRRRRRSSPPTGA